VKRSPPKKPSSQKAIVIEEVLIEARESFEHLVSSGCNSEALARHVLNTVKRQRQNPSMFDVSSRFAEKLARDIDELAARLDRFFQHFDPERCAGAPSLRDLPRTLRLAAGYARSCLAQRRNEFPKGLGLKTGFRAVLLQYIRQQTGGYRHRDVARLINAAQHAAGLSGDGDVDVDHLKKFVRRNHRAMNVAFLALRETSTLTAPDQ